MRSRVRKAAVTVCKSRLSAATTLPEQSRAASRKTSRYLQNFLVPAEGVGTIALDTNGMSQITTASQLLTVEQSMEISTHPLRREIRRGHLRVVRLRERLFIDERDVFD